MAPPIHGSTHAIPAYYSFIERLSCPDWLTCSGWFTHNSGYPSAAGRAQDRESLPARDWRSTTVPHKQPEQYCQLVIKLTALVLLLLLHTNVVTLCSIANLCWNNIMHFSIAGVAWLAWRHFNVSIKCLLQLRRDKEERNWGTDDNVYMCGSACCENTRLLSLK